MPPCPSRVRNPPQCREWDSRCRVARGRSVSALWGQRPVQALRFVGYLMHQAAHGAGSHSAAMHMCAPSADAHTQQQSVERDASRQRQTPRGLEPRHLPRHHRPSREASPCLEVTIVVLVTPVVARQGFFHGDDVCYQLINLSLLRDCAHALPQVRTPTRRTCKLWTVHAHRSSRSSSGPNSSASVRPY